MNKEPTDAQKKAGNYPKGHKFLHGMRISIENEAGSTRKGVDPSGKPWESKMAHDYGYIRYTTGKDKDHIDTFLGPEPENKDHPVFVIDQNNPDGQFDEHKVMLGFKTANDAYTAYHENYPSGHDGFDAINEMTMGDFKKWAYTGKSGKRKPVSELQHFKKGGRVRYFEDGGSAGDGGDGDGDGGSGGANGDGSGGGGNGPGGNGGPGDGTGDGSSGGPDGVGDGASAGDGADGGAGDGVGDAGVDGTSAGVDGVSGVDTSESDAAVANDAQMGINSLSEVSVVDTADPAPETAGLSSGLGNLGINIGLGLLGIPGAFGNAAAAAVKGNQSQANQAMAINGIVGMAPGIGMANAVMGLMGLPTIGTAVAGLPGVPASSVPGDASAAGNSGWNGDVGTITSRDNQMAQYYGTRSNQATPALSLPMIAAGYLPSAVPGTTNLYAKGGKVQGPLTTCSCGDHKYAEGGEVEDLGPYIGYRGRRQERNNDREGAKEMPLQALRGALTGTLGFGGDMEKLARMGANLAGADIDETPALPTSDFYSDSLPARPQSAAGRAAAGAGSALGMPMSGVALGAVRGAKAAAPAVRGALEVAARNASAPATLSKQAGAVKMPGGNWMPGDVERATGSLASETYDAGVKDWLNKRVGKYVRNEMGTAKDPLLKLEAEGKLHLAPDELITRADERGMMHRSANMVGQVDPNAAPEYHPFNPEAHERLTGRKTTSAWENLTDPLITKDYNSMAQRSLGSEAPGWMKLLDDDVDIHGVRGMRDLGFDHVRDYLDSATAAGKTRKRWAEDPALRDMPGQDTPRGLIERNLDIDPDKLGTMSLPDVIRKTSDWNKFIYQAKKLEDMNVGIKNVVKQYPESGHQWVELAPEGLKAEGDAMRHCVGGYCSDVEGGTTRILSLRDKKGAPTVTIELGKPEAINMRDEAGMDDFWQNEDIQKIANEKAAALMKEQHPGIKVGSDEYDDLHAELFQDTAEDAVRAYNAEKAKSAPSDVWNINQIKGPANRAPSKEVMSMVQDFVKTQGQWGKVADLENTGLHQINDELAAFKIPKGYYSDSDLEEALAKGPYPNVDLKAIKGILDQRNKQRKYYASGGSVGVQTVGLGTFGGADSGETRSSGQNMATMGYSNPFAGGLGYSELPNTGGYFRTETPAAVEIAAAAQPAPEAATPVDMSAIDALLGQYPWWMEDPGGGNGA